MASRGLSTLSPTELFGRQSCVVSADEGERLRPSSVLTNASKTAWFLGWNEAESFAITHVRMVMEKSLCGRLQHSVPTGGFCKLSSWRRGCGLVQEAGSQ